MPTTIQVDVEIGASALVLTILAIVIWRASIAEWRASHLLRTLLTEAERQQLASDGYLEVKSPGSPGRAYHIPRAPGRVRMYEDGEPVCELCLLPTTSLPASDLILMHKLLIEEDEAQYLATANHFAPNTLSASRAA